MERLERQRELPNVIWVCLSAMLGSGVFVLPGIAAAHTGPALPFAYLLAAVAVVPVALAVAELATAMPGGSGVLIYLDRVFGPVGGSIAGVGLWVATVTGAAFAALGFATYVDALIDIPIATVAVGFLFGLAILNMRPIRGTGQLQIALVAVSLLGVAAIIGFGALEFDGSRFKSVFSAGTIGLASAAALLFLAFSSFTKVASIAAEVRRPARNLPLALLASLAIAVVVYGVVSIALVGILPIGELVGDFRPIYSISIVLTSVPAVTAGAAVAAVLGLLVVGNSGVVDSARLQVVMSRLELVPELFGHHRHGARTPTLAVVLSGAFASIAAFSLDIVRLAIVASSLLIAIAIALCISIVVLRESRAQWYQPTFRAPLYPWLPVLGVLGGIALLIALGPLAAITLVATSSVGGVMFLLHGRKRAERKGVIKQRLRRPELFRSGQFPTPKPNEPKHASVVVALFGNERSPETLAELAEALAEGGRVEAVYLTELPEQTVVEAVRVDSPRKVSVRRRILAMAAARDIDLGFESITSRDVIETINNLTSERECKWLITEWTRRGQGRVTFNNPLGWLRDHLGSNLATFYDGGVRYFRELMVHVEPGPHDALVLGTADHLAEVHGANLTFVRFLPTSASTADVQAAGDYLDQVRELCAASSKSLILRGRREDRALIEASGSTDLMITAGVALRSPLSGIRGSVWDRVTESAACSVLRLRTPPEQVHTSFERYRSKVDEESRSFIDYIDERCVRAGLKPGKKDALFQLFAKALSELSSELDSSTIALGLWERERSQNTALGGGIALPHATLADAKRTYLGVFTASEPIDLDAPDGVGVDVFFVTMGPPGDRQEHLRLLGAIARLCSKTDLLVRLRGAWSGSEMLEAIRECAAEQGI